MTDGLVIDGKLYVDKTQAWWLYLFHGASMLFSLGALSFLPLIVNYLKRAETADSFVGTHHSWQIRSFWWYVVWMIVGGVCFMSFVGIPLALLVWGVAWVWKAYRLIRGVIDLGNNRAMPV
ncbi:hypothetical protein RGU70_09475 [Herbaspirillum sp. RTI4]|uniref:DUF4870 family protein n=1 Tax=Herbaspirillum sp. RTI4 TaxID=3048640 RepID=UPI002AB385CF|nr:hypothetical protein [Herbaspirillum sp. RTI4]MDY7578552.1 hypothetical protein [Herbaspirillum sp. RTI4]MEA9981142.1 hypothetical protein [Herbaspirillum sp. RTI4]